MPVKNRDIEPTLRSKGAGRQVPVKAVTALPQAPYGLNNMLFFFYWMHHSNPFSHINKSLSVYTDEKQADTECVRLPDARPVRGSVITLITGNGRSGPDLPAIRQPEPSCAHSHLPVPLPYSEASKAHAETCEAEAIPESLPYGS